MSFYQVSALQSKGVLPWAGCGSSRTAPAPGINSCHKVSFRVNFLISRCLMRRQQRSTELIPRRRNLCKQQRGAGPALSPRREVRAVQGLTAGSAVEILSADEPRGFSRDPPKACVSPSPIKGIIGKVGFCSGVSRASSPAPARLVLHENGEG